MSWRREDGNPGERGRGLRNRFQNLARAVRKLPRGKQVAVGVMAVLIVLTWLAACVVIVSLFAG